MARLLEKGRAFDEANRLLMVEGLVQELRQEGYKVRLEGDKIMVSGPLTAEQREAIVARKLKLVS